MNDFLGEIELKQSSRYKISSDTAHLASFMDIRISDRVIDVGTNNGALALVAAKKTKKEVIGLDIEQEAIDSAIEN